MTKQELDRRLRYLADHPQEHSWSPPNRDGVTALPESGMFRPGEMVSIHVHPTNLGPELPEGGPEPHRHEFIEIPFLWSGTCRMEVEGNRFEMEPGDFVILDTASAHLPSVEPGAILVNLAIKPMFFNDHFFRNFEKDDALAGFFASTIYAQKNAKRYLQFQTQNDPRIRQLLEMILMEYFGDEVCSRRIVENLMMVLFSTMVRLQKQTCANVTAMEQTSDQLVSEILSYMNDNLQKLSRDMLAEHFGYSYSYITTVLRSATGMTFSRLKNTLRLQRAELLLRTTDRPISVVAHDSGFSNVSNFYELFQKHYDVTPLDYRTKLQTNG